MRLRNVKNREEIMDSSSYLVKSPASFKGKWKDVFGNDLPIYLEIGMGKGDFLVGMAEKHPDWNFIGVEKYESVLVRAVAKLDKVDIPNVRVFSYDAIDLGECFDREITKIFLNFSDPWPKKRHYKRRLTYRDFLEVYDRLFESDAHITMKTDNDSLFESSLLSLNNYGYMFDKVILDLWSHEEIENVRTEYENKFALKGFKIKYIEASKKK